MPSDGVPRPAGHICAIDNEGPIDLQRSTIVLADDPGGFLVVDEDLLSSTKACGRIAIPFSAERDP